MNDLDAQIFAQRILKHPGACVALGMHDHDHGSIDVLLESSQGGFPTAGVRGGDDDAFASGESTVQVMLSPDLDGGEVTFAPGERESIG